MDAPRLRSLLLRGSVIAAANWPVVIAQGITESVVKALAGIPLAGAAVLLLILSVPDALSDGWSGPDPLRDGAESILGALATAPAALAGVAISALIAGLGAIALGATIKAGTVAVIAAGEARARQAPAGPLRFADVAAAQAWSRARFMEGCTRFGPRFVRLGIVLAILEGAVALGYASAVVQAYRGFVSLAASWWIAPVVLGVSVVALAISIGAELVYRLAQMALVVDDLGIGDAVRAAIAFVRRDALVVARVFLAALILSTLAFLVTLMAAAAFGLVSFVPVAGVAVLPLQAAVWVIRGLMLPFIELAALAAYLAVFRHRPAGSEPAGSVGPGPARLEPPSRAAAAGSPRPSPAGR